MSHNRNLSHACLSAHSCSPSSEPGFGLNSFKKHQALERNSSPCGHTAQVPPPKLSDSASLGETVLTSSELLLGLPLDHVVSISLSTDQFSSPSVKSSLPAASRRSGMENHLCTLRLIPSIIDPWQHIFIF